MGRPKLDLQGKTVGTLKLVARIPSVHTRYQHLCTACGSVGETDVRYLTRGCTNCNRINSNAVSLSRYEPATDIIVSTGMKAYYLKSVQLAVTLRKHPQAQFYYKGNRVAVVEAQDEVTLQSVSDSETSIFKVYDKILQELEGQPYNVGEFGSPKPDVAPYVVDATPEAAQPFTTPEGWLKLASPRDARCLAEHSEYDAPEYVQDWMDENPGCTFGMIATGGGHYAKATKRVRGSFADTFETDDLEEQEENDKINSRAKAKIKEEMFRATKTPEELAELDAKVAMHIARSDAEFAAKRELLLSRLSEEDANQARGRKL